MCRSLGFGLLLFIITLPGLVYEVGVNCIDVRLAKDVGETFHTGRCKSAFEDDVLELIMYYGRYLPKIRGDARSENMAPCGQPGKTERPMAGNP